MKNNCRPIPPSLPSSAPLASSWHLKTRLPLHYDPLFFIFSRKVKENKHHHPASGLRSHITYSSCSLRTHITILPRHVWNSVTENLPESDKHPGQHGHREEQHRQEAHNSFRFSRQLEGEGEEPRQDRNKEHPHHDQEVPRQPDEHHQGDEEQKQHQLDGQLDDGGTGGPTDLLKAHTFAVALLSVLPLANRLPVLIMSVVVNSLPLAATDIAKAVTTATSHMVASRAPLDNKPALLALPVVQVSLKVLHLVVVAFPLVNRQQALTAVRVFTELAGHDVL